MLYVTYQSFRQRCIIKDFINVKIYIRQATWNCKVCELVLLKQKFDSCLIVFKLASDYMIISQRLILPVNRWNIIRNSPKSSHLSWTYLYRKPIRLGHFMRLIRFGNNHVHCRGKNEKLFFMKHNGTRRIHQILFYFQIEL